MKRFFNAIGIAITMLIIFSITCFASSDNTIKQIINSNSINNSPDKNDLLYSIDASEDNVRDKVLGTLKKDSIKSVNSNGITINKNRIIKAYCFNTGEIVSSYKSKGSFSKLISNKYAWLASIVDENNKFLNMVMMSESADDNINMNTGKWYTAKIGYILSEDQFNFVTDSNKIENLLLSNNIKNPSEIKFILAESHYTNFLYIRDGDNEYAVPFSPRPDFTGLENGKLYNVTDIIKSLDKSSDPSMINTTNVGGIGSSNNITHSNWKIIFVSIIALFSIILLIIAIHYKKLKIFRRK